MDAARDKVRGLTTRADRFRDEVDLLRTNVAGVASELVSKKAALEASKASLADKERAVDTAKRQLEDIKARHAQAAALMASAESALEEREQYMAREEARVEAAERRLNLLKEQLFKSTEAVAKLTDQESLLQVAIQGAQRTSRNLSDRVKELDAQATQQQEHVYAAEFQIQQMERKIARASGEVSDEEKKILEARIAELNGELEEAAALEKGLSAQCKEVKEELKKVGRTAAVLQADLTDVQKRLDETLLHCRTSEEALRGAVREKEESMVAHDVLKLEVRKLREVLSAKTDEVFGLENRSAQLAMTTEARKREVEAHRALIRAQGKMVEEERHRLALDLTDRQTKIGLLKARYETLCARVRGTDDGTGEVRSQAYFILKAAQKREDLQREGDELDQAIRKAEREIKALSTTLTHLTARNSAMRDAFKRLDPGADESAAVRAMEQRLKDTADELFKRKRDLTALHNACEDSANKLSQLSARIEQMAGHTTGLEATQARVLAEKAAQEDAVAATRERLAATRRRHRERRAAGGGGGSARSTPVSGRRASRPPTPDGSSGEGDGLPPTPDEQAFVANGIRECSASVLFTLGQLSKEFPALRESLNEAMAAYGLKMPAKPPARVPGAAATVAPSRMAGGGGGGGGEPSTPMGGARRGMTPGGGPLAPTPITVTVSPGGGAGSGGIAAGGGGGRAGFAGGAVRSAGGSGLSGMAGGRPGSASSQQSAGSAGCPPAGGLVGVGAGQRSGLGRPPSASSLTGAGRTIIAGSSIPISPMNAPPTPLHGTGGHHLEGRSTPSSASLRLRGSHAGTGTGGGVGSSSSASLEITSSLSIGGASLPGTPTAAGRRGAAAGTPSGSRPVSSSTRGGGLGGTGSGPSTPSAGLARGLAHPPARSGVHSTASAIGEPGLGLNGGGSVGSLSGHGPQPGHGASRLSAGGSMGSIDLGLSGMHVSARGR